MVYKKYIKRGGKTYGPYLYKSVKKDGKVITEYHGRHEPKKQEQKHFSSLIKKPLNKKILVGILGVLSVALLVYLVFLIQFGFTGKALIDIQDVYNEGDSIMGSINLVLWQGELFPADSDLRIDYANKQSSFSLRELISNNLNSGNFYIENTNLSGSGEGYGIPGEKEIYPLVDFSFRVISIEGQSNVSSGENATNVSVGGGGEETENTEQPTNETPEIITNESEETPVNETIEEPENVTESEEPSESEIPPETSEETSGGTIPEEPSSETPSETPTETPEEQSVEETPSEESSSESESQDSESSSDSSSESASSESSEGTSESSGESDADSGSGESGGDAGITGEVIGGGIIEGQVSKIQPYEYQLNGGETIEILESSQSVSFEIENGKAVFTTEYSEMEEGFGAEYLGDEELVIPINISEFGLRAKKGTLKISFLFNGEELLSASKEIKVTAQNITNTTKEEKISKLLEKNIKIERAVLDELLIRQGVKIIIKTKPGVTSIGQKLRGFDNYEFVELNEFNIELLNELEVEEIVPDQQVSLLVSDSENIIRSVNVKNEFNLSGQGKRICLIDTGVDGSVTPYTLGFDFVNYDNDASDDNGHGTQVAYIAKSVAPYSELLVAKVLDANGNGYESDVLEGLQWCQDNNADIISFSIGAGSYGGFCDSNIVAELANQAVSNGIFVLAATGNDGTTSLKAPACASKVARVASTDKEDNIAGFSNVNEALDVFAPGVDISTKGLGGSDIAVSGTSASAPFVAGGAALILQNESLAPLDLRYRLASTGKPIIYSKEGLVMNISRLDIYNAIINNITMIPYNATLNQTLANLTNYTTLAAPSVTLITPFNDTPVGNNAVFICNASDDGKVAAVSLWGNWTSLGWHKNQTINIQPTGNVSGHYTTITNDDGSYNITFQPNATYDYDSYIRYAMGSSCGDYATTDYLNIYTDSQWGDSRGILKFDVSVIPKGVSVESANLILTRRSGSGTYTTSFEAYEITKNWTPTSVGYRCGWAEGGEFTTSPLSQIFISNADTGPFVWNVTNHVADWVNDSVPNYGFIVSAFAGGSTTNGLYVNSSNSKSGQPQLTIRYNLKTAKPTFNVFGIPNGIYNWGCEVEDDVAQKSFAAENRIIYSGRPKIDLVDPIDKFVLSSTQANINFSCNIGDDVGIANVSLYGNWTSSGWHPNQTINLAIPGNVTNHYTTVTNPDGSYTTRFKPSAAYGNDTYMISNNPDSTSGSTDINLFIGGSSIYRILMGFDISVLPVNAQVQNAVLGLSKNFQNSIQVNVYRVTNDWIESQATWNSRKTGVSWSSAGGEFDSTIENYTTLPSSNPVWVYFNITGLVAKWVNKTYANYGLLLRSTTEGGLVTDFVSSDDSDSTRWPTLNITYTIPKTHLAGFNLSNIQKGSYSWNCQASDVNGNAGFSVSNFSFYINPCLPPTDGTWYVYNNCNLSNSWPIYVNGTTVIFSSGALNIVNSEISFKNVFIYPGGTFISKNSKSTIWQNGNLTINGNYVLQNSTLRMNGTTDGGIGILVNTTGNMVINQTSNITNGQSQNFNYFFRVENGSNFSMTNSSLSYSGWADSFGQRGLELNISVTDFSGNTLKNNYFGVSLYKNGSKILNNTILNSSGSGIFVYSPDNLIANNTFSFNSYGVYLKDRNPGAYNNTIDNNNISFNDYGIFISSGFATGDVYGNTISNNLISNNSILGIGGGSGSNSLYFCNNLLYNNLIINNFDGLNFLSSGNIPHNNSIVNSIIANNTNYDVLNSGFNITFINTTFDKNKVSVTGGYITVKWYLDAGVFDEGVVPVSLANVSAYNFTGNLSFWELTNANGIISRKILSEFYRNSSHTIYQTNYTINATKQFFPNISEKLNITQSLQFNLSTPFLAPVIQFVAPTEDNDSVINRNWVVANFSITERNPSEVRFNWNGTNYPVFGNSLVLMYNFDNVSALGENSTDVVDVSGRGSDGKVRYALWNSSGGRYRGAFEFNNTGTTTRIDGINMLNLSGTDKVSVSLWVRPKQLGADQILFEFSPNYNNAMNAFVIYIGTDNKIEACLEGNAGYNCWEMSGLISIGQWYHVVAVFDKALANPAQYESKVYINGALNGSLRLNNDNSGNFGANYTYIGARGSTGGVRFIGNIDDVMLFNRNLSLAEINGLYASSLSKYDLDKWNLFFNRSNLGYGVYTYYGFIQDIPGNSSLTETRTITYDPCWPISGQDWVIDGLNCVFTNKNINLFGGENLQIKSGSSLTLINSNLTINQTLVDLGGIFVAKNSKSTIWQNGNLTINGNYVLQNSTLRMNGSSVSMGNIGILVNTSGNMAVNQSSEINNGNDAGYRYPFIVRNGSSFSILDSSILHSGWENAEGRRGLEINTSYSRIENNTFVNLTAVVFYSNHNLFLRNRANKIVSGIQIRGGVNNLAINNTLNNNFINDSTGGFYLSYSSLSNISNNNISFVIIGKPIDIGSSNNTQIFYNNVFNNSYGISLSSENSIVSYNNIYNNSNYGLEIYLNNATVSYNTFKDNIASNIYIASDNNTILNNNFSASGNRNIWVNAGKNNTVLRNNLTGAHSIQGSIYLSTSATTNNSIINNTINSLSDVGIYLGSASYNLFSGNNLTGGDSVDGSIYLDLADFNVFINNILNSPNIGVRLNNANNNTFISQFIRSNSNGIELGGSGNLFVDSNITLSSGSGVLQPSTIGFPKNILLNTSYINLSVGGGEVYVQWYFVANASDDVQTPIQGANVSAYNATGNLSFWELTNANGLTSRQNLTHFVRNSSHTISWNNYTINATRNGFFPYSTKINLTGNMILNITLSNAVTCGDIITTPGNYVVKNDVINYTGFSCIRINVSDVDLNCRGHLLDASSKNYTAIQAIGFNSSIVLTNVSIRNCRVNDFGRGLELWFVNNSYILNSSASGAREFGVRLIFSSNNTLRDISSSYNLDSGINLATSNWNLISNLSSYSNDKRGIYMATSDSNQFVNFSLVDNPPSSPQPGYGGVNLLQASKNNFSNGVISHNYDGIYPQLTAANNRFFNLNITNNSNYGVSGETSPSNNYFYNNLFNNTYNFEADAGLIYTWNTTRTLGTNIIGGPYVGGNYWADPYVNGYSQSCIETNGDGICDSPYALDASNIDWLPLTSPNNAPTVSNVVLTSSLGYNTTFENLSVSYSLDDPDFVFPLGITDWRVNGNSIAILNMPFATQVRGVAATIKDYSIYGNNGMLGNTTIGTQPAWTGNGKVGGAYGFDGLDDFVNIPASSSTNLTSRITVEAWINPAMVHENGSNYGVMAKATNPDWSWQLRFGGEDSATCNTNNLGFQFNNGSGVSNSIWVNIDRTLTLGQWWHVVGTYNGTHASIYLNGVLNETKALNSLMGPSVPLLVGNDGWTSYFNGTINNVRIYNRSLSAEQIMFNYQAESGFFGDSIKNISREETNIGETWNVLVTPNDGLVDGTSVLSNSLLIVSAVPTVSNVLLNASSVNNLSTDNLTVYYNSMDPDGDNITIIKDWRVNGNSGVVLNMPFDTNISNISQPVIRDYSVNARNGSCGGSTCPLWARQGKIGGAYIFNGSSSSFINISNSNNLNMQDGFTLEAWVNVSSFVSDSLVISKYGSNLGYKIFVLSSGGLWLKIDTFNYFIGTLQTNQWHNVVGTWNKTHARTYLDGASVSNVLRNSLGINTLPITIGSNSFNGTIDEVKVYNKSLSAEQILENYNAGLGGGSANKTVHQETTKGEVWSVALTPNDAYQDGATVLSNNVTIRNSLPNVSLFLPVDGNVSTNRTVTFFWNGSDVDGKDDIDLYQFNITKRGNSTCTDFILDKLIVNVTSENYTYGELECLKDDQDYYLWTVRAWDGENYSEWAVPRRLEIQSLVSISLLVNKIDFGLMYPNLTDLNSPGDSNDTTGNNPLPFLIENNGSVYANITVNATNLWNIVNPNNYFKYKIDNTSEIDSFDWVQSKTTWRNVTSSGVLELAIVSLNYKGNDSAEVDLFVQVPPNEPAGNKQSIITFTATRTGAYCRSPCLL